MKARGPTALCSVLFICGAASADPPVGDAPGTASEAAQRHEQSLSALEARMQALKDSLAAREAYRDALYAELERIERDIGALARAGHQLDGMIGEQRRALAALAQRRGETAARLAAGRAALADLLRSAYAMGRGDQLRLLLNQEDPNRIGRVFGYYRALGRARAARIREVEALAAELAALTGEAQTERARLARLAERQRETRERLERTRQARAAIGKGLDAVIAGDRRQVATLDADAAALRSLIEQLRRQAEIEAEVELTQEAIAARRGRLRWPLPDAELVRGFGDRRAADGLHADGVLLAAATGSEVRAVHHGRVVYADWLRGFGLLLVIDHGDGYMTLYGHNESLLKEVGEWVAADEVVALAGTSGGSGERGLYFAIRRHGEPLDPAEWCSRPG